MAEKSNTAANFGAVQQNMTAGFGFFKKAVDDAASIQAKWVDQSFKMMDEYNTLAKAGMKYWADLGADARKLTSDLLP